MLAGAAVLAVETVPYFVSGLAIPARIEALVERDLTPGLSFASQKLVLDDCYASVNSLEARASPQDQWNRLLTRCDDVARSVYTVVPTHGYAWLVGALVAASRGDDVSLNERLQRSRVVAPHEGWLAAERIKLAERGAAAGTDGNRQDIEVVVDAGIPDAAILRLYASNGAFRDRLNAVLETRPAPVQQRAISRIRSSLAQGGT